MSESSTSSIGLEGIKCIRAHCTLTHDCFPELTSSNFEQMELGINTLFWKKKKPTRATYTKNKQTNGKKAGLAAQGKLFED